MKYASMQASTLRLGPGFSLLALVMHWLRGPTRKRQRTTCVYLRNRLMLHTLYDLCNQFCGSIHSHSDRRTCDWLLSSGLGRFAVTRSNVIFRRCTAVAVRFDQACGSCSVCEFTVNIWWRCLYLSSDNPCTIPFQPSQGDLLLLRVVQAL